MSNISWANEEVSERLTPSVQKSEIHIDYDIHGVVAVRLVDCPPVEAAAIAKKYGSLQRPLSRTPDIIVRFVKELAAPGLTHLGLRQYAYTETDFFLIAEKNAAKTKIDFEQIGSRTCEIVCESGTPSWRCLLR